MYYRSNLYEFEVVHTLTYLTFGRLRVAGALDSVKVLTCVFCVMDRLSWL